MIWMIMALRAFVSQSILTYLPVHYARLGYSLVSIGGVISAFTIAGAISGLIAGHLSDRIGHKPIFYTTHVITPICILLMLHLPGPWIYISSFLTGFFRKGQRSAFMVNHDLSARSKLDSDDGSQCNGIPVDIFFNLFVVPVVKPVITVDIQID